MQISTVNGTDFKDGFVCRCRNHLNSDKDRNYGGVYGKSYNKEYGE